MLQQFTWQQFLIASMVLSLIWYAGVILFYYRTEFLSFLGRTENSKSEPLPHRWETGVEVLENGNLQEDELIGKAKLPEGVASVAIGSFGFVQTEDERETQVGLVPDVLQEIKEIFGIIEKEDGSKKDFFNLMEMVREKFPKIGSNPNITRINQFISEHAPFHLSADELENLWD
ncbi:MAG: hypothetical protein WC622_03550 [Pedobacter sp.]|uniref:hypothetical protein n=1 Tax=Pedobacter sp. TaxID=1411316 RepID=UPI003563C910